MASAPETSARPARISRFSVAERLLHWLLAVTFFVMLGSGLALYVPALSNLVARPTAKAWHIDASLALLAGVAVLLITHWSELRATLRELDRFDRHDASWLRGAPRHLLSCRPSPPQRRFNAGQKLNSALVAGLMGVAFLTGFLLWYGERNTRYRFAGTVIVHDWAMFALIILVAGHLYLALVHPSTRHALRGIILGSVNREWARRHHATWVAEQEADEQRTGAPSPTDPRSPSSSDSS